MIGNCQRQCVRQASAIRAANLARIFHEPRRESSHQLCWQGVAVICTAGGFENPLRIIFGFGVVTDTVPGDGIEYFWLHVVREAVTA